MNNWFIKILLTGIVLLVIIFVLASCATVPKNIILSQSEAIFNYNNYLVSSSVQYSGNFVVGSTKSIFGEKLHIYDGGKKIATTGYSNRFQLYGKDLYFLKGDDLYHWGFGEKITKEKLLKNKVLDFIVYEDGIIFSNSNDDLWYLNRNGKEASFLSDKDIHDVAVNGNYIYALDEENNLYRLSKDLSVCEQVGEDLVDLITSNQLLVVDDDRVLLRDDGIYLYDIKTKELTNVGIEVKTATDIVVFNTDGKRIFVSYQATDPDGSVVNKEDHSQNGVWSIDIATMTKTKLSDTPCWEIYIYNDHKLLIRRDGGYGWLDIKV